MKSHGGKPSPWLILGLAIATLVAVGGKKVYDMTRGLRNNNPGNIRRGSTQWQGMKIPQTDSQFVQFISPEYGIRALTRVLQNYRAQGIVTVRQIISRWAPPTENDTESYIHAVSQHIGKPDNVALSVDDMQPLVEAIIRHENGVQPYGAATIAAGIALA